MSEQHEHDCPWCDGPGEKKTYANQTCMPLNGKVQCIDRCIHKIVAALNAGGILTTSSCCGHQKLTGFATLLDGRTLLILPSTPESAEEWPEILRR